MTVNELKFDENGLIPAVAQDYYSGRVLTLAYMNRESLEITMREGQSCFYSRSRNCLWRKGESSGNTQRVVSISANCEQNSLLLRVIKAGPACHTGTDSCFENTVYKDPEIRDFTLQKLYELIQSRKAEPVEGAYTSYLFNKGIDKILKKVGEESAEVIIASKNEGTAELIYELSDLAYHALVLMVEKGVSLEEIAKELAGRMK